MIPYELLEGRKPNISYSRVFGHKCFILINDKDKLAKFETKVDKGVFLGHPSSSKAYRVFKLIISIIKNSIHVAFDETKP